MFFFTKISVLFFAVYFTCIVKVMYNLCYYQIVTQLCSSLTEIECNQIIEKYSNEPDILEKGVPNLGAAMAFVLNNMSRCRHLRRESVLDEETSSQINMNSMEQQLQKLCLPFLRIATLLRHDLYHQEMPHVASPQVEFVRLIYYLDLVTESMDWDCFNAAKGLCFIPGTERSLAKYWCDELMEVRPPTEYIRELVINQHVAWQQPRLLGLPKEYERLFTVGEVEQKCCTYCFFYW